MIRIVLAEGQCLIRQAMEQLLDEWHELELVESVGDGRAALQAARRHLPHVVLMDLQMPGMSGIEATERITRSDSSIGVIAVTGWGRGPFPERMLRAGARGYVLKQAHRDDLINAIYSVSTGQYYLCSGVVPHLARRQGEEDRNPFDALTRREFEVLMRVLNGKETREMASELTLSPKTISTYRKRLLQRIGVENEAKLTRAAVAYGIIDA